MKPTFLLATLAATLTSLPTLYEGCPSDDDDDTQGTPVHCGDGTIELDGICVPDLPEGWSQIVPGGETICARGGEYSYFVRPGKVNKLVIGFDGGGACWDALTCSTANPTFDDSVTEGDNPETMTEGVFDDSNPENPFSDWYAVFIPYCTGDIHWGDAVTHYEASNGAPPVTIAHNGFKNAQTVMDWVYSHFEAPERIFITGVSAGSYGTMMFAPYVMDHYPESDVVQLGDCGAGVITQEWLETSFSNWNAMANTPEWIPEIHDADPSTLTMNDVYIYSALYYPDQLFSQYNTVSDDTQEYFYQAMGGDPADWGTLMEENIAACSAGAPNFRYYTQGGSLHGVIPYNELYTYAAGGVRLVEWVNDMAAGKDVQNVHCADCTNAEEYTP